MPTTTRSPRNGVDVPTFFATLDALKESPEAGKAQFRGTGRWINGTHSRTTFSDYTAALADHEHPTPWVLDTDHTGVLLGHDEGPTPMELVLHALAGCITAGIANIASAKGVDLHAVTTTIEGDYDLQGLLGLDPDVRNGFEGIRLAVHIEGDAPAEVLRDIVERSRSRSAVYDMLTGRTPVSIEVDAS